TKTAARDDRALNAVTTTSVEAFRTYTEGLALQERHREADAAPLLEKAVAADPKFALALAKLADVAGDLGDGEKAHASERRARGRLSGGRRSDAVKALNDALTALGSKGSAASAAVRNLIAEILLERGQPADALAELGRALEDTRGTGSVSARSRALAAIANAR